MPRGLCAATACRAERFWDSGIAIRNIAVGAVAVGSLACGLVTPGAASFGLACALGGAATGCVYAIGGGAFGPAIIVDRRCDPAALEFGRQWFGTSVLPPSCR